jgi:hypothetical protein
MTNMCSDTTCVYGAKIHSLNTHYIVHGGRVISPSPCRAFSSISSPAGIFLEGKRRLPACRRETGEGLLCRNSLEVQAQAHQLPNHQPPNPPPASLSSSSTFHMHQDLLNTRAPTKSVNNLVQLYKTKPMIMMNFTVFYHHMKKVFKLSLLKMIITGT